MRTEVQNQIRMLGKPVAAEVPKRCDTHRRWLQVAPLHGVIQLLEVEVPVGVDPVEWPRSDDDYVVVSVETFPSLGEALSALMERGVDTNAFDAVWKGDNPF
ncbi:hypothetical protein GCM10027053_18610 [Intrasporangium mesophilum]